MDRIRIDGIVCQTRLGVTEEERSRPQRIILDVVLDLDLEEAVQSDDISRTCDYHRLVDSLQKAVEQSSFSLVEALAGDLCRQILSDERVFSTRVRVRKFPSDLKGRISSVAVELTRGRDRQT